MKLEQLEEETDYVVKTRSPMPSTWSLNILRGKREDDMRNESMSFARRKCKQKVLTFSECEK